METKSGNKTTINIPIPTMIRKYTITLQRVLEMTNAKNRNSIDDPQPQPTRPNIRLCYNLCYNNQVSDSKYGVATPASSKVVAKLATKYFGLARDLTNSSEIVEIAFTFLFGVIGSTVGSHVGASLLPDVGNVYGALVGAPVGVGFGSHIIKKLPKKHTAMEVEEEKPVEHPVLTKPKWPHKFLPDDYFSTFYAGQHAFWCILADL